MTWTYTPGGADPLDRVRLAIGDTLTSDQQFQDEEINLLISTRSTLYGAAAECCRSLAAKFSRSVTFKAGQSSASFSDLSRAYALRAIAFDQLAAASGAGVPYAGGISEIDMLTQDQDGDLVPSVFTIGMDDNMFPVGPVGPEVQSGVGFNGEED